LFPKYAIKKFSALPIEGIFETDNTTPKIFRSKDKERKIRRSIHHKTKGKPRTYNDPISQAHNTSKHNTPERNAEFHRLNPFLSINCNLFHQGKEKKNSKK